MAASTGGWTAGLEASAAVRPNRRGQELERAAARAKAEAARAEAERKAAAEADRYDGIAEAAERNANRATINKNRAQKGA